MKMTVHTKQHDYDICLERGILSHASELVGEVGIPFLISDDGVPKKWRTLLQNQFPNSYMHVFPNGEGSKNIHTYQEILTAMLEHHVSRNDTVIALGGGVVGDMAGFAAATYMRGIRYINIPTTVLSQIDSSIGGKTAIDMNGVKNCVGAFWQPSLVLIDPDTLTTLPERQISNGLAEAVKAGMIRDEKLFELFEKDNYQDYLEEIIERSLNVKRVVVENDERESGERKLLNFGHTYGHAIESSYALDTYLHGECVGMGMMLILQNEALKERLKKVLERLHLPISCNYDEDKVVQLIANDKKADHSTVTIVQVDELGKGYLENWTMEQMREGLRK